MGMVRDNGTWKEWTEPLVVVGGYGGPCNRRSSKAINKQPSGQQREAGRAGQGAAGW